MKNLKYKVIFISNPNPENPDLQLELLTPEFYLTRLKNFSDFIHTIQCQRETLVTGQRKAELEIEDINFCTMPVCAGASARMQSLGSIIFWSRPWIDS